MRARERAVEGAGARASEGALRDAASRVGAVGDAAPVSVRELVAAETLARIERSLRGGGRTGARARVRWIAWPLAAAFLVLTAWASASGQLARLVAFATHADVEHTREAKSPAPSTTAPAGWGLPPRAPSATSTESAAETDAPSPSELAPSEPVPSAPVPSELGSAVLAPAAPAASAALGSTTPTALALAPAAPALGSAPAAPARGPAAPLGPAPAAPALGPAAASSSRGLGGALGPAGASDVDVLYREAHDAHFERRDPQAALVAWDRYLAAAGTNGKFVLEARYNRALSLVRLGRKTEAVHALKPFANGDYGGYRREEAIRLLQTLE
ncbi:MAG: hypothetical protein KIT84_40315 [Labilithrix sp.]|nr:hypothetical protein [Labilithrix sp.]MCW5817312.1 hypothetical protein [Labilithrix sp.]